MKPTINRDDWLSALQEVRQAPLPDSSAITVSEFAEMCGLSRCQTYRYLRALVKIGKATQTTKHILRADGGIQTVPAYKLNKKSKP